MLGSLHTDLLVTVTLLFLTQTETQCRAENDFSLVTLPDWRTNSEYVTQCFYNRHNNLTCDWTRTQITSATEDVAVNSLESGPLGLEGEACLEFWYLAPIAAKGSELRALLKSSTGLVEIWTSPALPRDSWKQVFVPLNVIETGTQVVLEAVQAVSMEGQGAFNQIGVRRGSCGHQCESNTDLWTDESTRCLCSAGQLSCSPSLCPKGQICGPKRGDSSGISASGMCTIHSNTDCSTFDGVLLRFITPCTYTLAKTCSLTEALPVFNVEVVEEQNGNSSQPAVQQIIVETGNFRVTLLKRQTSRVVVNGVWRKLPLQLSRGTVNIKSNPAAVILETSFGLSVSYDSAGAVHVSLPPTYSDHVCGLCGNFNHLTGDDFRKPDGTVAQDATALAESWQTGPTTSSCETILIPHQCDPLEEAEYGNELYCGGLLSSTGPFADCLSVLTAESYFSGCVVSMCTTHGDPGVLCETLQAYADICQEAGVAIPIWRNTTFCPLQCGENSHYNSCADGCPEVCSSLDFAGSCGSCEERCECDSGFKLSGGKCVPAEDCGCWYDGKHYEKGETFLEGECVQQCQCMGNNDTQCTTMHCADNEICKVKDGVKGCFPFNPATCSVYGDPHYITFDGMAYDFQGGCSYTLTTTCGAESSVQFTVIGHNVQRPLHNFTRSKLEAVSLQLEDLYLTLNQSGDIYVNKFHARLPYSRNGAYGSVRLYMKNNYMVLETTFGLRVMIDRQNRLFLQVDEHYKYELCGLCGTYSGQQDDDFITPGGQNVTEPFEFGDSWRVPGNNECIVHPNDPRICDYNEENEAYDECYTLLGDAFKTCHELIHPSIYINSCVYDYCATSGDQHTLCESLKSYAVACQVAGVELPHWQTDTACDNPPTTATLPTSPTPDQTLCSMNCNFEKDLCGWEQLIQDRFDWTRNSGPTPSNLTGPNQDHTTGAGSYMYIEGDNITHGDSARLQSSMCHYNGPLCLYFWYHMYGSAADMALNVYLLKDNNTTKLWSMMNNQGPEWQPVIVDIRVSGPFQIILEGIRGSNAQSDVAIDDISIHSGSCAANFPGLVSGTELPFTTPAIIPSHPTCNIDCSFDSNLCRWNQMITDAFEWTWQSGSTPTLMTGPSGDHTGDGHYLYIEANSATYGDTARLISSECSDSGPQCLQFWYHMYGSAHTMGLHVYLLQNKLADAVWQKRNDQGNMWHLAQVDFTTTGAFQIIFEGRRGSNEESDVAIDDIKLYRGRCSDLTAVLTTPLKPDGNTTAPISVPVTTTAAPEHPLVNTTAQLPVTPQPPVANVTKPPTVEATTNLINKDNVTQAPDNTPTPHPVCQLHCNFERDLCQWSQLLADVFDWTRHSGSTPTIMTGPSSDHTTGGGHYLYIEANSATYGDTARLISSECSDSGPQCLQFWYHMYGSAHTMGLHVYLLQNKLADAVWQKRNDQGNMWHLAQVDFTTTGAFQIIFEGRRGSNEESDVAIDDIKLYRGRCSDLTAVLTTPLKPDGNTTAPISVPVTTTAAPEHPLVNTTAQLPVTPQPPVTNVTKPPTVEATTNLINKDNVTQAPDNTPTPHPVCQLHCNFERDLCQWSQLLADVFDWTRHSGSTPTIMTGPSSDHTTGGGHYLYIEANSATYGDTARLISSECSDSGPQCLQFWYHMYGSAHTMGLHVYLLQNKLADAVWQKRNDQGNMWHLAQVDFTTTGAFQIIFEGRRGSNEESDVAIDDIKLYRGRCSDLTAVLTTPLKPDGNTTAPISVPVTTTAAPEHPLVNTTAQLPVTPQPPVANVTKPPTVEATTNLINKDNVTQAPDNTPTPHPVCQLHCNFERDLCQWSQLLADVFDWTRHSGSTPTIMTGPSSDHTTGGGHYLYIEANSATYGDTARLISSECSDSGPQCLQFWYHMYGSAHTMGLHVYLLQNKLADAVWQKRNDQGNMWHLAQVDFTTTGAFQIIFEGRRGSNDQSDVAIDDVTLHRGHCADLAKPTTPAPTTFNPVATEAPEVPPANTPTATQPPQPPSTFTTMTNAITTAATDYDTQTTTTSVTTVIQKTSNPDVPTTRPQLPITSKHPTAATAGPQTTDESHPQTTEHEEVETSEQPESPTTAQPQTPTTAGSQPSTETQPQTTVKPQPPTTPKPPTTATSQPPTTTTPKPPTTGTPQPPTTTTPKPPTTATPQPPATTTPKPPTTATPQPPITTEPHPPTTEHEEVETSQQPKPETTERPETTVTTTGPQSPTETQPQTTAKPQPPTTTAPKPPTTEHEEVETSEQPESPTTAQPQPPTTAGSQPSTETQPQTTVKPQLPTTPKPPTTAQPQPPTTAGSQPPTTTTPKPTTTEHEGVETSQQPESETTERPKTTVTTAGPQPPTGTQPQTTAKPQPPTTTAPKPQTTEHEEVETSQQPEPPTTAQPQPPTTATPQPPTTTTPKPPTTATPQPPATTTPKPSTTATSQPPITTAPKPPTTASPQPPITTAPKPPTTEHEGVETSQQPEPETTERPETTVTTAKPQPPTTTAPKPQTTEHEEVETSQQPEPPTTAQPQPPTTATPQPPTETQPQTTVKPQPPTTTTPKPLTTATPQPPTTTTPKPPTTATPQPPTTTTPKQPTTAGPQPPITTEPHPPTTEHEGVETSQQPEPEITERPKTTAHPEQPATSPNEPQPPTTAEPQPPTTVQPQPPTTVKPQPSTTTTPKPPTTPGPQPPATTTPKPSEPPTTVLPQPTTARPQPTTTPVPTPSCPQNSHYTTCIPACNPTCTHLNGPPGCSDNDGCVQGCVCNEGYVQKRRVCVPIQQCGCVDRNGTVHQFDEVWYTNHCSQKCECEKDHGVGKIECTDEDECDGNAVCLQNQEGDYYCQSTGFNECTIKRDLEYRTFDKMKYDFEGEHSYVLVQSKNLPNNLPHVYIEGINTRSIHDDDDDDSDSSSEEDHIRRVRDEDEDDADDDDDDDDDDNDDDSEEDEEHYRLQKLKIRVYNHTVEFKKKRRLVVDGKQTNTPVSPAGGLHIYEQSSRIYLKTDFGLSVEFDGHSTAEIILPRIYKRKVGGLCGNFDSQRQNDWMKPDGTRARTVREFVESWRV